MCGLLSKGVLSDLLKFGNDYPRKDCPLRYTYLRIMRNSNPGSDRVQDSLVMHDGEMCDPYSCQHRGSIGATRLTESVKRPAIVVLHLLLRPLVLRAKFPVLGQECQSLIID